MANKNDVVIIELDRPRELRFGHKALKTLSVMTKKSMEEIEGAFDPTEMETYLYCGLLSDAKEHGETLKLEDMEDLLDLVRPYSLLVQKMTEAFGAAFGSSSSAEGNGEQGK
jgi:hypothetical protein